MKSGDSDHLVPGVSESDRFFDLKCNDDSWF